MPDLIQKRALSTWHKALPENWQRDHAILGLVGEAGELADIHKKDSFKPDYVSTVDERILELGDVLYYVAVLAHLDGWTLEEVSRANADKLAGGHGWKPDHMNK